MAKVLKRERLVPNVHMIEIHAPEIAQKCKPGQFVIIMVDEFGERIPLTIADWDANKGSVTAVFLVVGTSTHKLSFLEAGDEVPVFVGLLGMPSEIKKFGVEIDGSFHITCSNASVNKHSSTHSIELLPC